jgi:hypothetical protein
MYRERDTQGKPYANIEDGQMATYRSVRNDTEKPTLLIP